MKFKFTVYPTTFHLLTLSMDYLYQAGASKRWRSYSIAILCFEFAFVNFAHTEVQLNGEWTYVGQQY